MNQTVTGNMTLFVMLLCNSQFFLSIYATVEMNTDLDPVGTAVPGEIEVCGKKS